MTTDDRNFRSAYYEKVGCRGVEEKKSLEMLLRDKPFNRLKLKQFCMSFTVPAVHRSFLWNLLLDVIPVYPDCHTNVMEQRTAVYDDLLRALQILQIINDKTPMANTFYAMWLLENRQLNLGCNINNRCNFVNIADVLLQTFDKEVEIYWITKGFYKCALEITNELPQLKELSFRILEKEDNVIYTHLERNNLLIALPFEEWYGSCFAGVIAKSSLIRIWDKICGGSRKIVVFVFIVLFNTLWRTTKLPNTFDWIEVAKIISYIKDNQETADLIVNKSIELWQQNKEHTEFRVLRKTT